ncbi:MAG: DUF1674 domain-containing protein [Pseudomonadota bacterium]
MSEEEAKSKPVPDPERALPEAAKRALAEAAERRKQAGEDGPCPTEVGGREDGLDPARYGDWEKKGLAIDF